MIAALDILLALFALLGTLTAFGGKTWIEGKIPLRKRITRRGWYALLFLGLTLPIQVARHVYASEQARTLRVANEEIKDELAIANRQIEEGQDEIARLVQQVESRSFTLQSNDTLMIKAHVEVNRATRIVFFDFDCPLLVTIRDSESREMVMRYSLNPMGYPNFVVLTWKDHEVQAGLVRDFYDVRNPTGVVYDRSDHRHVPFFDFESLDEANTRIRYSVPLEIQSIGECSGRYSIFAEE